MPTKTGKHPPGDSSHQLLPDELARAQKSLPFRVVGFSIAALAAAAFGAFTSPDILRGYDTLSWLLILVPAFMLAYYRGWRGSTQALAAGTLLVLLAELAADYLLGIAVNWVLLLLVAVALMGIGVGLGVLTQLIARERERSLTVAYTDPVTGLPTRRLLDFVLAKEFAASKRGRPLSVVLFKIDGFDEYNGRHGHTAGDEALRQVAACLKINTKDMNTCGRYEGVRFMSILSGETVDGAWALSERVGEMVANLTLPTGSEITIRAGIATYESWVNDYRALVELADRALQEAKNQGGNRIVCETASPKTMLSGQLTHEDQDGSFPHAEGPLEKVKEHDRAEEEDQSANAKLLAVIEAAPVAVFALDSEDQVQKWNEASERIFGCEEEEVLGRPLPFHSDDEREEFRRLRDRVMAGETLGGVELHRQRRDGSHVDLSVWAAPLYDEAKSVIGMVVVMVDVSRAPDPPIPLPADG